MNNSEHGYNIGGEHDFLSAKEKIERNATVYRMVDKEKKQRILDNGLSIRETSEGKRDSVTHIIEEVFQEELERIIGKKTPKMDRRTCIYAFPQDPRIESMGLSLNQETQTVVSFDIDASRALVCDGEMFSTAGAEYRRTKDKVKARANIRDYAIDYWKYAVPLSTYLDEKDWNDDIYFQMPEILIFEDIPKDSIH